MKGRLIIILLFTSLSCSGQVFIGAISMVEQFYKDTRPVKYTGKFSARKDKEIYYYKYNPTINELVSVIGAEGKNLIFKMFKSHAGDISIAKIFSHYQDIKYSDTEYAYFSPDFL